MKFRKGDKIIELIHPHTFNIALRMGYEPIEESEKNANYKCKYCDFETDNRGELLAHYRNDHPKSR